MVNIIRYKYIPLAVSALLVAVSLLCIAVYGLKPGIDFTGGSLLQVGFTSRQPSADEIATALSSLNLGALHIQPIVNREESIVKMRFITEQEHQAALAALRSAFESPDRKVLEDRFETIGPAISLQLRTRAVHATLLVIAAIVLYIAYVFRKVSRPVQSWKYGFAALVALVHDISITIGFFAVFGAWLGVEVDIAFVVALLTVLGFSVNDTIVVFDRIRENLIRRGAGNFSETVNVSVNETFARSINTSATALMVLLALFLFGGESIHYFTLALLIGITFGTYSSIFVASTILVVWHERSLQKA